MYKYRKILQTTKTAMINTQAIKIAISLRF